MAFRLRNSTNTPSTSQNYTSEQKTANKIHLEAPKLKKYGEKFLYEPAQINIEELETVASKTTSNYLYNSDTTISFNNPTYEKEELLYDKRTNRWVLVPLKDMYKYES